MKPFKSDYCKIKLICHQKAHNGETHLNVIIVIKLLFLKVNLNLIRSGEKSYKCEECDKNMIKKLVFYVIREYAVVRSNINVKV